jgi:2-keto-4-pentenoate hydratase/2-oxohepta-3-ene-1,7-dioic acid hydratase in catechol pathway
VSYGKPQACLNRCVTNETPKGPIAVPTTSVDKVLRVQTRVNGELRQNATTDDLIFSIPYLIKTMSEGQTLMPGDVLATGTVS